MRDTEGARRVSSLKAISRFLLIAAAVLALAPLALVVVVRAQSHAQDPGVRGGPAGAGNPFSGLTTGQQAVVGTIQATFTEINSVTGGNQGHGGTGNLGLGPRFDLNSCSGCHAQPATGGSAPFTSNLFSVFDEDGALNEMPYFEAVNGSMLNTHFPTALSGDSIPSGFTQQLFTITGRFDAGSCDLQQPNFTGAESANDISMRTPLPMFGDGLVEIVPEPQILANQAAQCASQATYEICGTPQLAPDTTISRFGWKGQERSVLLFAASAYNIEEGVSNAAFPNELDETNQACILNGVPEDHFDFSTLDETEPHRFPGDPERQALFIRFLQPPTPAPPNSSTMNGQNQFNTVGCNICHSSPFPTQFVTPASAIQALGQQKVNLYSDLLLHHMGNCLADGVIAGVAGGDMFRTPPLWGVGQRIYFMHDGRTTDIVQAVEDHSDSYCTGGGFTGYQASEADIVINSFNALSAGNQQDLINFLRSL
jgi:cytochrome c peroxidase